MMLSTDGHERSREHEDHTHLKGKSSHRECTSGHDNGGASKCGRSAEPGSSLGHPHAQRSDDFTVKADHVIVSANALIHTRMCIAFCHL